MFCIVSFGILAIMGIFSASNRALAREALDCVLRRVTFRPCNTGFDEKMKARILGVVITRSEGAARFLNKYFEALAWAFFIITMAALIYSVRSVYLFYTTGSCNGLNSSGFCVFDPNGSSNQVSTGGACKAPANPGVGLGLNNASFSGMPTLNPDAALNIKMIGCYHCDYTRESYPEIRALVDHYKVGLTYINFPSKEKDDYFTRLGYCVNKQSPEKFWKMNDIFFTGDKARLDDQAYVNKTLQDLGLNPGSIQYCTGDPQTETAVSAQMSEIAKTNFYGTPTIFIKDEVLVGPKPYRVYAIALEGLFFWLK